MKKAVSRFLSILIYFNAILQAIIKGIQITWDSWPDSNPFASGGNSLVPVGKQQGQPDQPGDDPSITLEEPAKVSDSASKTGIG